MSLSTDTPQQQANLQALSNGYIRSRLPDAVAATGSLESAANALGINYATLWRWLRDDPTLRAEVETAKRRTGERCLSKLVSATLNSTDTQVLQHPTAAIMVVNSLLPELRPNGSPANVAVQVNVTVADFAAALRTMRQAQGDARGDNAPELSVDVDNTH